MALTTLPQQTLRSSDRRQADRRQDDQKVAVERRSGDRRLPTEGPASGCGRTDATSFSAEAMSGSSLFASQTGQISARKQLNSTLGNLLQAGAVGGAAAGQGAASPPADGDWAVRQDSYRSRAREMRGNANIPDDTLRNLKITQDYSKLSNEMRQMMGPEAGANWCTFATWASRQAGETIRQEDLGSAARMGKKAFDALGPLGFVVPGGAAAKAGSAAYDASSAQVAAGNRKVYQEIAPQFARFIETFKGDKNPDPEKLRKFQEGFAKDGSQNGLREAFNNYHKALFEKDPDKKKELMFLANGQIGEHEQRRLQPQIQAALPYGSRGLATSNLMRLGLPDGRGGVNAVPLGDDVPTYRGQRAPAELRGLQNQDAQSMFNRYDKNPDSLQGSGAAIGLIWTSA